MRVIHWSVFGKEPQSLPCCSVDGHWQRWLHLRPRREWKMTNGHARLGQRTCHHMPQLYFTLPIRKFLPITYMSLCSKMSQVLSISHPASILGLFFLCWITGVSNQPVSIENQRGAMLAACYTVRHSPWNACFWSRPGTGTLIKNSSLSLHAFFCMNLHSLF